MSKKNNFYERQKIGKDLLICGTELEGEGGDDEAAEGAVVLVGIGADKAGIGAGGVAAGEFVVLVIAILPEGESLRVGHLGFALRDGLREGRDDGFAVLRDRTLIRITVRICESAAVAGAHDDTLIFGKLARKMVKRDSRFYFSHSIVRLA